METSVFLIFACLIGSAIAADFNQGNSLYADNTYEALFNQGEQASLGREQTLQRLKDLRLFWRANENKKQKMDQVRSLLDLSKIEPTRCDLLDFNKFNEMADMVGAAQKSLQIYIRYYRSKQFLVCIESKEAFKTLKVCDQWKSASKSKRSDMSFLKKMVSFAITDSLGEKDKKELKENPLKNLDLKWHQGGVSKKSNYLSEERYRIVLEGNMDELCQDLQ